MIPSFFGIATTGGLLGKVDRVGAILEVEIVKQDM